MLRCGLLGKRWATAISPMIHHEVRNYDYRLFEVPKADLDLSVLRPGTGLNVCPYEGGGDVQKPSPMIRKTQHHCQKTSGNFPNS